MNLSAYHLFEGKEHNRALKTQSSKMPATWTSSPAVLTQTPQALEPVPGASWSKSEASAPQEALTLYLPETQKIYHPSHC